MKKGTAGIIENFDGSLLLHLRDNNAPTMKNQWCLVGGSVKSTEEGTKQALIREVKEETGLDVNSLKLIQGFSFNNKNIDIYHCYVDTRRQKVTLGEGSGMHFFAPNELNTLIEKLPYKNQYLDSIKLFLKNR
ncbi:NUDIX hydrolase [Patescibacteria group bacterium]|nr:NUDIX hydrolase [Patescibacteria group bacterium]MBU1890240.1 NUDIX hydrolase [Patescibacteria group bacterium]